MHIKFKHRPYIVVLLIVFQTSLFGKAFTQEQKHDYLLEKYKNLHDSPMQQKFEKIAPVPVGSVYIMRPGETEEDIRKHFRTMKELGFTALKGLMTTPGWTEEEVQ